MSDQELYENICKKIDLFVSKIDEVKFTHPYIVISLLHDFSRSLYPADPYIPFDPNEHRMDYLDRMLDKYVEIIEAYKSIGSYGFEYEGKFITKELKYDTGKVYGQFWKNYPGDMVSEAVSLLSGRFEKNNISLDLIKGKRVLDAGCGSGRYSCAMSKIGAEKVIGLDYGVDGLEKAKELASENNIDNIEFVHGSVLEMPFEDEAFDFVWQNGVFQHTDDIEKANRELYRVLKKGGSSWYYIYGDKGVLWHGRRRLNDYVKTAIPQDYAMRVLELIGMPMNRFPIPNNWYAPIDLHVTKEEVEMMFERAGFHEYTRVANGRDTDPDYLSEFGTEKDKLMWGDGELRYMLKK